MTIAVGEVSEVRTRTDKSSAAGGPDLGNVLEVGADVGLRLTDHGVSVVRVS